MIPVHGLKIAFGAANAKAGAHAGKAGADSGGQGAGGAVELDPVAAYGFVTVTGWALDTPELSHESANDRLAISGLVPMSGSPARIFKVFLSSPGDVSEERREALAVLGAIQRKKRFLGRVALSTVLWDDPVQPAPAFLHETPQLTINDYKLPPSCCDLCIAILWSRLGSLLPEVHFVKEDGSQYASGTEWEVEDARRHGKPVLAYFSQKPLPRKRNEEEQRQTAALDAFLDRTLRNPDTSYAGGLVEFSGIPDFTKRLESDLEQWIDQQLGTSSTTEGPNPSSRATPVSTLPDLGRFIGRRGDMRAIDASFSDVTRAARLILAGAAGVGKSHLATEWARINGPRYSGGTFFIPFNADPVHHLSRLVVSLSGESVADQARRALATIRQPTLLVYDNVDSEVSLAQWLPPPTLPAHVLVTSTLQYWSQMHEVHRVGWLDDADGHALVAHFAGKSADDRYGRELVERAGGLTVELRAAAMFVDYELQHGREPAIRAALLQPSQTSFEGAVATLSADAQLAARAAALFNPAAVPETPVGELLEWDRERARTALDGVCDRGVATRIGAALRMHGLMTRFLRGRSGPTLPDGLTARHAQAFLAAAQACSESPANETLRAIFAAYPHEFAFWEDLATPLSTSDCLGAGKALMEIGAFGVAQVWFEQVVAGSEKSDVGGSFENLCDGLHHVGYCLLSRGEFQHAQVWFERAVAEKTKVDRQTSIDHQSVAASRYGLGNSLFRQGKFAEARSCFERAVVDVEKGDVQGRVDHLSLGGALHQVGFCWFSEGEFVAALPWFERAVLETEKGDLEGRVDHMNLARSMHQLAFCHLKLEAFGEARSWLERAAGESKRGDVHGRVDHESLGKILHQVGICSSKQGDYQDARSWFERAVTEKQLGDVYARVDHDSVGISLHRVASCRFAEHECGLAYPLFERALAEKRRGDIHGRVNHQSLGESLHAIGECLVEQGDCIGASARFEAAVAEKERGEEDGSVDVRSVASSLRAWASCLRTLEQEDAATECEERANALGYAAHSISPHTAE